jgi:hypothetical protein
MVNSYPIAYAAYNNDLNTRMESTSGGVFTVIAEYLMESRNAVVYGAAFDEEYNVKHIRVNEKEGLRLLRGSKYPQSDIGNCFRLVKQDLDTGRVVLFTGTPCQIVGLQNYIGKRYNNLFTMDFVCHGVASDRVWRDYVHELSKKGKIKKIVFKYKYKGWKKWYFRVDYEKGYLQRRGHMTKFMHSYLSYVNIRPSCYECVFKGIQHISDFTISDCWGIAEKDKEINDNFGLSALLLQNERALNIYNDISSKITTKLYDATKLMEGNWTAFKCVPKPNIRREFFQEVNQTSGSIALDKYFTPTIKQWLVYFTQKLRGQEK